MIVVVVTDQFYSVDGVCLVYLMFTLLNSHFISLSLSNLTGLGSLGCLWWALVLDEPYRGAEQKVGFQSVKSVNHKNMFFELIAIALIAIVVAIPPFDVPPAQVVLLSPKGFEVSIPGEYFQILI